MLKLTRSGPGHAAALCFVSCVLPLRAHAQASNPEGDRWLMLPAVVATQGEPMHPARTAARLLGLDLRAHGTRAMTFEEAKSAFEQHGSTPPMTASAADIDELAKDAQRALYHVASGLPQRAKQDVERVLGRARHALESLNRETRAAQHLLDACLFLVRAHLIHGDREAARAQALECRRLVPDIAPDGTMHPPDVIGVLAEAQAQLLEHEPAALRIESEPMGCAAYVNGRNLGPTPKELSQLSPGEYRLQVECDPGLMGRVHRVTLGNSRVVANIDTRYDRVIESLFDLSLHYATSEQASEYAARDAVDTARVIGASDVIVAQLISRAEAPARVQLDRYRVADGAPVARAIVAVDEKAGVIADAELVRARETLSTHTQPPLRVDPAPVVAMEAPAMEPAATLAPSARPTAAPLSDIEEQEPSAERSSALPIVGYALGGIGVASFVAGWVLYTDALGRQQTYADALNGNATPDTATTAELTALRDVESADSPPLIGGAVGAALVAGSTPLWLPASKGIAWWGWLSGGVGLVVAATGAALSVDEASCDIDRFGRCTEQAQATHLGAMLMLQAAPLLAVPVVQGIRALTGTTGIKLELGPQRALLRIEGRL